MQSLKLCPLPTTATRDAADTSSRTSSTSRGARRPELAAPTRTLPAQFTSARSGAHRAKRAGGGISGGGISGGVPAAVQASS